MSKWTPIPGFEAYEINPRGTVRKVDTGYVLSTNKRCYRLWAGNAVHYVKARDLLDRVAAAERGAALPELAPGRGTCKICGGSASRADRLCRACADAPPPPRKTSRRCVECGAKLKAGYWRRCPDCLNGQESGLEIYGVAL